MSFIEVAPVSATICADLGLRVGVAHLRGQEALDHRDFGLLDLGAVVAAVLAVDVGGFAALLDHFLQDFGDERVVILGRAAGARLDVAVLDRRRTRRSVPVVSLSPPFIAAIVAALMSSRIMASCTKLALARDFRADQR